MQLSYRDSGVDIQAGNDLVKRIQSFTQGIGGFAGTYPLGDGRLLAATTDGVGTKLELAQRTGRLEGLGQDLVGMCVNDLITIGARPLFFLDYYACGRLDVDQAETVIRSIQKACVESNCLLLGGETAEMPGFYADKVFDLAGFAVGLVDEEKLINGQNLEAGDLIFGIPSSGPHSNGYSLIRRILQACPDEFSQIQLSQLLEPTRLYVKPVMGLLDLGLPIKAMAHITGGGWENLERVLPSGRSLDLDWNAWKLPALFRHLQQVGGVQEEEMRRTFNCGFGMALFLSPLEAERLQSLLPEVVQLGKVA
ncbi:phosphoribosylformylglycinamidine cyclo-ligase [bacterium]|nr:phosphoribosylformylglycinamidine cyclo-ligase [bacterium]